MMNSTSSRLALLPERRGANRYSVDLRMEIWPEKGGRGSNRTVVLTRDVSIRGVYFFGEIERQVDSRFNFVVVFLREISGEDAELMEGVARTVRCERLKSGERGQFGVAAVIEETTHLIGE